MAALKHTFLRSGVSALPSGVPCRKRHWVAGRWIHMQIWTAQSSRNYTPSGRFIKWSHFVHAVVFGASARHNRSELSVVPQFAREGWDEVTCEAKFGLELIILSLPSSLMTLKPPPPLNCFSKSIPFAICAREVLLGCRYWPTDTSLISCAFTLTPVGVMILIKASNTAR